MLDKRCRYKIRECRDFYLFIKYKQSHIYHAKFPAFNKTRSTGQTSLRKAYEDAYRMMDNLLNAEKVSFHKLMLDTYKDKEYRTYNAAKRLSELLKENSTRQISSKVKYKFLYFTFKLLHLLTF